VFIQANVSGLSFGDGIPPRVKQFVRTVCEPENVKIFYYQCGINSLRGNLAEDLGAAKRSEHRQNVKKAFLKSIREIAAEYKNAKIVYCGMSTLRDSVDFTRQLGFPPGGTNEILKSRRADIDWF